MLGSLASVPGIISTLRPARGLPTVLLVSGVAAYAAFVGAAVPLGASWALAPAFIPLAFAAGLFAFERPLAIVLLLTPLLPDSQRLPLLGLQVWGPFLFLVVLAVCQRIVTWRQRVATAHLYWIDILVGLWFLWLLGSFALAGSRDIDAKSFAQSAVFAPVMYVAGRIAFRSGDPARWLLIVGLGASLAAVELWAEYARAVPLFSTNGYEWAGRVGQAFRAGSMLDGPNFAGQYLAISLAGIVPLVSRATVRGRVAAAMVALLLTAYIPTLSISASIGMGIAGVGLLIARGNWAVRAAVIGLVLIIASPPVRSAISEQEWFASHNQSINTRLNVVESGALAAQSLGRDPLQLATGAGYGQWVRIADRFTYFEGAAPGQSLENTYLSLFLEDGLVGVCLLIGVILLSIRQGWRGRDNPVRLAGGLVALTLLVIAGTGTLIGTPTHRLAFFLLAATQAGSTTPDAFRQVRSLAAGRRLKWKLTS
jgi:hypothetical protein